MTSYLAISSAKETIQFQVIIVGMRLCVFRHGSLESSNLCGINFMNTITVKTIMSMYIVLYNICDRIICMDSETQQVSEHLLFCSERRHNS